MYFENPEILYALFLLLIPVLVHLFRLRKFRKEKFTNVKFLKKAALQTRKSSQIKKWLVLFTRLLLLACVILAFAKPHFEKNKIIDNKNSTVIYLDNSFSMQAKGKSGILLKRSIQEILEHAPKEAKFSLFTNTETFKNTNLKELREELLNLSYSPTQLNWKSVELKAQNLLSNLPKAQKDFIAISDFQGIKKDEISGLKGINTFLVLQTAESYSNISVDTAFIASKSLNETLLEVHIRATKKDIENVAVSLYNGTNLLAKKSIPITNNTATTVFELPKKPILNGKISIEDNGLPFDNTLFFSINYREPIKVVAINQQESSFLERIYNAPEFQIQIFPKNKVDFTELMEADLIILNELIEIPLALGRTLKERISENVQVLIIPSEDTDLQNYNSFFTNSGLPQFQKKVEQEKLITIISFNHPLYQSVFEEKIENFQYPKVNSFYVLANPVNPVLAFEGGQTFLYQKNNVFVFTAALNKENSNFKNSPLIVPTLYNIGNLALKTSQLYYNLGEPNQVTIKVDLQKDGVLKIQGPEYSFIPRQRSFQTETNLFFENKPNTAGQFKVLKDSVALQSLSFNVNRAESELKNKKLTAPEGIEVKKSIASVFENLSPDNENNGLWKWFVTFALFFLLLEMFILKFFK